MATGDVHHLVIQGTTAASKWQMSFYYEIETDDTDPMDNDNGIINGWFTGPGGELIPIMTDQCSIDCGISSKVFPLPLGNTYIVPFAGAAGTAVGESLPATDAAIITLLSATAGRQTRGRKFIPGISEDECNQGGILDSLRVKLIALADEFEGQLTIGAGSAKPVIAHRDPDTPFNVISRVDIVDCVVRPRTGTQRSRRTFRTNIPV